MSEKQYELIQLLLNEETPLTAKKLAMLLDVSDRSVKSYIKSLNELIGNVILASSVGYKVDYEKAKQLLESYKSDIPQSSEERKYYILQQLIKSKTSISRLDLEELLFISESTLNNELNRVKEYLMRYDLELKVEDDYISIDGAHKDIRRLISTLIYDEANQHFLDYETIQQTFPNLNVLDIKNLIIGILNENNFTANDYQVVNLILHVSILIDRILNDLRNEDSENIKVIENHNRSVVMEITQRLEQLFHIKFRISEINDLNLLLLTYTTNIDYTKITDHNLSDYVSEECMKIVEKVITILHNDFFVEVSNEDFLVYFSLHLNNLLNRMRHNYVCKNPLTQTIKTTCPYIYDCSVSIAHEIYKETNMIVNEDEIAYIALHLGNAIQDKTTALTKLNTVIIYPDYHELNQQLAREITMAFSESITINEIITNESELSDISKIDLVLSTVPLRNKYDYSLMISPFFNDKDKTKLFYLVEKIKRKKETLLLKNYLHQLSDPDLFKKNKNFKNEQDAITYMSEILYHKGLVDERFVDELLERERMSSTAFKVVAIPHTITMSAKQSAVFISVHSKGIVWGEERVRVILLLAMNKRDKEMFSSLLNSLTYILSNEENVLKLSQTTTLDEFIDLLPKLYTY
jgi:lichenan operon transcriptional antiterminator